MSFRCFFQYQNVGSLIASCYRGHKTRCPDPKHNNPGFEIPFPDLFGLHDPGIRFAHTRKRSGAYAGSGGFLFMICKSPQDAARVRQMLEQEPLNDRSRFFDFEINHAGLEVTTC